MDSLEQVKKLREEYERALDAAESRRAAYHKAVLDLYQDGTPLREIAKELGLSHQRVHQIVSGEPPRRRSKLPRAAGGLGALLLVVAVIFGATRLARAPIATASVPRVLNAVQSIAVERLAKAGFKARVVHRQRNIPFTLRNTVYAESGAPGERLAKGSTVTLYVALPKTITLRYSEFSDLPALNRKLARRGFADKAVPVTARCAFDPRPQFPRGFLEFVQPNGRGPVVRPTATTTISDSGLSSKNAVDVIAVGRSPSGRLEFIGAGARLPGPSCVNSAAFYTPEVRVTPLPASRGRRVTLVAWLRPRPVRSCAMTVWDQNGSHAQSLSPGRLVRGRVSWTWRVGTNTNLGKHRIIVNCGSAGSLRTLFTVSK
jgi:transcriptional regulator with XRE-family HTH domain